MAVNLLALPGLGTFVAGRKTGLLQMALALVGFAMTTIWLVKFVFRWIQTQELPDDFGPHFHMALLGILLFIIAWVWSLGSSVQILGEVGK